jgi:membrane protein YqaA with SNARE-associated domain
LFRLGYFGPFVMGLMDSSFLFLPFGNDLLVVALVARHHHAWWLYVITAICGSTLGVFALDLVARKVGETGVQKVAGRRRFAFLKRKIDEHGAKALVLGCLAPPPFPFTMLVATTSALAYPKRRLLLTVAVSRGVRFLILALLALKYGRAILHIVNSEGFKWTMIVFSILCVVGSVISITGWVRGSRRPAPVQTAS